MEYVLLSNAVKKIETHSQMDTKTLPPCLFLIYTILILQLYYT